MRAPCAQRLDTAYVAYVMGEAVKGAGKVADVQSAVHSHLFSASATAVCECPPAAATVLLIYFTACTRKPEQEPLGTCPIQTKQRAHLAKKRVSGKAIERLCPPPARR